MAEIIRKPSDLSHFSEAALEIILPKKEGPCNRFSRRKVHVTFCPHASCKLKSSPFDIVFYFFEKRRVDHFDKIIYCCLTLKHSIIRVFLKECHCLPEVVVAHLHRLGISPKPVHIHMCMSYHMDRIPGNRLFYRHSLCLAINI